MSNELVAFGTDNFAEIAALTGASVRGSYLPTLKINRDAEDDSGETIPPGTYCITQDGKSVFSKTATFRPFLNAYQYLEYNPVTNSYDNKSIIIKQFFEEAFDERGTLACGKVKRDLQDKLPLEEQTRQKNIKCYRHLYGLVSFNEEVKDVPVVWKLARSNFNAPQVALDTITKLKHLYFQHNLNLSLKREKQGATVYYISIVEPNLKEILEFTADDMGTFKMFQELINTDNKVILNKWKAAKKSAINSHEDDLIDITKELELNDELPF